MLTTMRLIPVAWLLGAIVALSGCYGLGPESETIPIAIANDDDQSHTVNVTVRDSEGEVIYSERTQIDPHTAIKVHELTPDRITYNVTVIRNGTTYTKDIELQWGMSLTILLRSMIGGVHIYTVWLD